MPLYSPNARSESAYLQSACELHCWWTKPPDRRPELTRVSVPSPVALASGYLRRLLISNAGSLVPARESRETNAHARVTHLNDRRTVAANCSPTEARSKCPRRGAWHSCTSSGDAPTGRARSHEPRAPHCGRTPAPAGGPPSPRPARPPPCHGATCDSTAPASWRGAIRGNARPRAPAAVTVPAAGARAEPARPPRAAHRALSQAALHSLAMSRVHCAVH